MLINEIKIKNNPTILKIQKKRGRISVQIVKISCYIIFGIQFSGKCKFRHIQTGFLQGFANCKFLGDKLMIKPPRKIFG